MAARALLWARLLLALASTRLRPTRAYPNRNVEIIVPYGPGGSTDIVGRIVAQKLQERLGQNVVVLNRPGASGTLGLTTAMRAKPDGYTLLNSYTAEAVVVPQISKTHKYSAVDDFEPIAITGLVPVVLMVSKNVKANTLQDFIAEVRANPGKFTFGGGYGSPPHVMGAWMNKLRGLNVQHVPYRGGAQGINDVVGGHIDMFYGGVAAGKAAIDSGSVKADRGDRRHALLGAAERADLQGGRRAGVRSGELDRDAGAERHARRDPRNCFARRRWPRSTIRRPARRSPSRASRKAQTRTYAHFSSRSAMQFGRAVRELGLQMGE